MEECKRYLCPQLEHTKRCIELKRKDSKNKLQNKEMEWLFHLCIKKLDFVFLI